MAKFQRSRKQKHLYRDGAKGPMLSEFECEYERKKGKRVYGATVGKVKRERLDRKRE